MIVSCPNCQKHYKVAGPGIYECLECGTDIIVRNQDAPSNPVANKAAAAREKAAAGKGANKVLIYSIAGGVVVIIAAAAFYLFLGDSGETSTAPIAKAPAAVQNKAADTQEGKESEAEAKNDSEAYAECEKLGIKFSDDKLTLVSVPEDLTGDIVIPEGVRIIGRKAFSGSKITSVTFPASLVEIQGKAFNKCKTLAVINFSTGLKTIGSRAFQATAIKSVVIPEGVTKIGGEAFQSCGQLTSVTFPDSLEVIEIDAFTKCPKLTAVTVSANVKIDEKAFDKQCKVTEK